MTTKTLEQEARELYKVIVSAMKPETPRYTEIGEQIAEFQFVQGYLAAATARDKEIEELQVELIDLRAVRELVNDLKRALSEAAPSEMTMLDPHEWRSDLDAVFAELDAFEKEG